MLEQNQSLGFFDLPEHCVSMILSFATPSDVCRSSSVSSLFRSAADSDYVWEKMLPPDYVEILARSAFPGLELLSKKNLYFRLCSPILIDSGRQSFWLERSTGKKCYMLSARKLEIIWGADPRYWNWFTLPESRFLETAHLRHVCWFDISCKINLSILSPHTQYMAYLIIKREGRTHGFDYSPPVEITLAYGGHVSRRNACLHRESAEQGQWMFFQRGTAGAIPIDCAYLVPRVPNDGWSEVELGELLTEEGDQGEVEMHLFLERGGQWKGGITIEGIELRPERN